MTPRKSKRRWRTTSPTPNRASTIGGASPDLRTDSGRRLLFTYCQIGDANHESKCLRDRKREALGKGASLRYSARSPTPPWPLCPGRVLCGEVAERSKAPHSKCGVGASSPWVRIPPSPPRTPRNPWFLPRFSVVPTFLPTFPKRLSGSDWVVPSQLHPLPPHKILSGATRPGWHPPFLTDGTHISSIHTILRGR